MRSFFTLLKKRWYLVGLLLVLLGVGFWRYRASQQALPTYVRPIREDIRDVLEVSTKVTAAHEATLKFLGGGKIVYLGATEGATLRKFQTIATIDVRDLQKSMAKTLNDYMTTRLTFEQSKDDRQDLAKTEDVLRLIQKSQLSLENAVTDVELKDLAIRNSSLIAPFEGILVKSPVDVAGSYVTAADAFTVIDPTTLEFVAEVDEVDVGRVQEGMLAEVILDAYPEETIPVQIHRIALSSTLSTKSSGGTVFLVNARVPSTDVRKFRLGMNGTMQIILRTSPSTLTVPIEAISTRDGKSFVMVRGSDPKKPIEREVTTGIEGVATIEITSGLQESDDVVVAK